MTSIPYSKKELHATGRQKTYKGDATEAAFLLGGIGAGNISVGARGELRDWEIHNTPAKGKRPGYTFFSIFTREADGSTQAKVLESRLNPPFSRSHGFDGHMLAGLPRFRSSSMRGEYPFVWIDLKDPAMPVAVRLEAFTPFIPCDAAASGYPAAILRYKIRNITKSKISVTVAGSLANEVCRHRAFEGLQEWRDDGSLRGLRYACRGEGAEHLRCGSMALVTADTSVTWKRQWMGVGMGGGLDGAQEFWTDFSTDGELIAEPNYIADKPDCGALILVGSLGIRHELAPGEERDFEFILSWYFPNRTKGWADPPPPAPGAASPCGCGSDSCRPEDTVVKTFYATQFPDAWGAALSLRKNLPALEETSRDFHRALFQSSLPAHVIDALAANITVIRSTTCFRIADGTFFGWEGCCDLNGCCHGTCTHVWNYAQTLAFLFPELERSMRRIEFNVETDEKGKMAFRNEKVFTNKRWEFHPAADGQMGTIIRLYREWKLSGDDAFLREVWDGATRALDFAFSHWDSDGDCVLDSQQHNTYDIEFYGPNSLVNSIFLGALKAAAEMAAHLGDTDHAAKYRKTFDVAAARMDAMLWGGEYYIQKIANVDQYRYQYGKGCLSDQLLGQLMAHVAGLGYVLPEEHVRKAIHSVFRYNFLDGVEAVGHVQRVYALNDERGLLLCSWPHGGRPALPFIYSDEVWTGIEYQVAAHLIYEGFLDEGLAIVKAVRERHDGYRRNPWNEVECGHHYARAMASWALLTALSGFQFDMTAGTVSFSPRVNADDFRCFWSAGSAWGVYTQKKNPKTGKMDKKLKVLWGDPKSVRLAEN